MSIAVAVAYTLLSTPLYRPWVTIEVYPPTVDVSEKEIEQARGRNSAVRWSSAFRKGSGSSSSRSMTKVEGLRDHRGRSVERVLQCLVGR